MFITRTASASPRPSSAAWAPPLACRCSTPMVPAATALAATPAATPKRFGLHVHPARRRHGVVDAGRRRRGPRAAVADADGARAASRTRLVVISNLMRAGGVAEMHAAAASGWLSGAVPKRTEGAGLPHRHHDRSGAGAARSARTSPFPSLEFATEDFTRLRRRLHARLQLRLHEHDLVGDADDAAADGDQPARGVRAAVRRRRIGRRAPAHLARGPAASSTPSPPRRGACRARLGAQRSRRGSRLSRHTCARSSGGFSRPKAQQRRRASASATSRSAFPSRSKSTRR